MNTLALMTLLLLGMATASISMTLTKARIFKPLRDKISAKSEWCGELASCPYCTGHWIAAVLVGIYRPQPIPGPYLANLFVDWFAVVTLAAVLAGLIYRAIAAIEG